jgi:hypothetical protein
VLRRSPSIRPWKLLLYDYFGIQLLIGLVLAVGLILGGLGSILGAMSWRRHRRLREWLEQLEEERKTERTRHAQRANYVLFLSNSSTSSRTWSSKTMATGMLPI